MKEVPFSFHTKERMHSFKEMKTLKGMHTLSGTLTHLFVSAAKDSTSTDVEATFFKAELKLQSISLGGPLLANCGRYQITMLVRNFIRKYLN